MPLYVKLRSGLAAARCEEKQPKRVQADFGVSMEEEP